MTPERAAIIQNASDLATWAAQAVVETDALIETCAVRPLSPHEQRQNLLMQRELLVRMSQQGSLVEWAASVEGAPWWARWWFRARRP